MKGGVFVNSALGLTRLDFTADDTGDANLRLREQQLSFVGEFKLQGRYHILPNVSVRAAYEMMLITSAALADCHGARHASASRVRAKRMVFMRQAPVFQGDQRVPGPL